MLKNVSLICMVPVQPKSFLVAAETLLINQRPSCNNTDLNRSNNCESSFSDDDEHVWESEQWLA